MWMGHMEEGAARAIEGGNKTIGSTWGNECNKQQPHEQGQPDYETEVVHAKKLNELVVYKPKPSAIESDNQHNETVGEASGCDEEDEQEK